MKVTAIHRAPAAPVDAVPRISHYPGSAVFHGNKPFFIPEISESWVARPAIAMRLCRLGKSIDRRFAPRYYDAAAPALIFVPTDIEQQSGMDGMISAIDNTVAIGQWQPLPDVGTQVWHLEWPGGSIDIDTDVLAADEAIESVSRFMTIQMGDALLPFNIAASLPAIRNTQISVSLNNNEPFTVRIK